MLFALCLLGAGCAHMYVAQAKEQMAARLNPLLGSSQQTIIQQIGAPTSRETIAGTEVWTYFQSFGARGNTYANAYANPYGNSFNAFGVNRQWEMYDKARLYFTNGAFVKWDGYVQR